MYDIKSRRLALNMTLEEVGEIVGVGKSTVRKWENGMIDNMKRDKIALLAKALKISPLVLLSEDSSSDEVEHNITTIYNQLTPPRKTKVYDFASRQLHEQSNKVVPLVGATAANPQVLEYADAINDISINTDVPNSADCALVVRGNSMETDYMDGSIVFYKRQEMVENGELAIVEIDGDGVTFKKVIFDYENQQLILRSLNPEYPDRILKDNEYRIIGKVVK
ncbi:helix-turn-helix domain-containing protein [Jeotgalibaca porci]|uniref:helix-turn-helix domain-containing protein n=1 Tax=Jeotgalibaca porci TaxID=1868793 RepID=UPI0035A03B26